jgi:hypothetical protein
METQTQDTHEHKDAEMTPNQAAKVYDQESYFVPVDVLLMVKTAQNQNGLRNNDYYRYYKYCSRKIHRLRKATKFTQGRRKFVKNEITSEKVRQNQRAVQIPLYTSERDWAHAQFLKKQLTENGDEFIRNKHTSRKKLKKAYESAKLYFDIVSEIWDKQTIIESEAYVDFIKAALDIEYGRYAEAIECLLKTSIIYKNLAQSKDSLEAAIYDEKIEQIEPMLRLCTYNLQNQSSEDYSNIESLETKVDTQFDLKNKVTSSLSGYRKEVTEDLANITYQGKSIPLKTQKLKNTFSKLEHQLEIMGKSNSNDDLTLKDKISNYTTLLHIIEECMVVIQKEKSEETKKSEASGTLYNLLLAYVSEIKNSSIYERCLLKAFAYAENIPLAQVFTKQKLRAAQRPQQVMKLFDRALKALKTIARGSKMLAVDKIQENSTKESVIQSYLRFYTAIYYANEKRYDYAYIIASKAREEADRVTSQNKSSALKDDISKLKDFNENQIEYILCKCQAMLMLEQQKKVDSVSKDFGELDLEGKHQTNSDITLNIVDWLFDVTGNLKDESNDALNIELTDSNMDILNTGGKNVIVTDGGDDNAVDMLLGSKIKLNKKAQLINLFPKMQPVMPKPFFYDIALDAVEYPNIAKIITEIEDKATQSTGLFGRIKGAFFG